MNDKALEFFDKELNGASDNELIMLAMSELLSHCDAGRLPRIRALANKLYDRSGHQERQARAIRINL